MHGPVLGQVVRAALVEEDGLLADGAGEAQGAAARRESTAIARRADVAAGPRARGGAAAADDAGVRLREYGELVGFLVGARPGDVRDGAAGVGARLGRRVRRRLHAHGAGEAQRVPAGQQHRLAEELLAGRAAQLVLHAWASVVHSVETSEDACSSIAGVLG